MQILARHGVWVSFERHLSAGCNPDALTKARQNVDQLGRIQHRRCTTAEKHRLRAARRQAGLLHDTHRQIRLSQDRRRIVAYLRARPETHRVRIEITVPAAHATKRHVHVQGQRATTISLDEAGVKRSVSWPPRSVGLGGTHECPSTTRAANADDVMSVAARIDASRLKVRDDATFETRRKSATLRLRILRVRTLAHMRVLK